MIPNGMARIWPLQHHLHQNKRQKVAARWYFTLCLKYYALMNAILHAPRDDQAKSWKMSKISFARHWQFLCGDGQTFPWGKNWACTTYDGDVYPPVKKKNLESSLGSSSLLLLEIIEDFTTRSQNCSGRSNYRWVTSAIASP